MIDIHTHLLPGVDDGSPSIAASLPILEAFANGGVETVICTPHLNASAAAAAPIDRHREILAELTGAARVSPKLLLGWEIMLDIPGVDLSGPQYRLGESNAVLVEFPRTTIPPNAADELFRLRTTGVVPVIAHPERYWGCTAEHVEAWRRAGAVVQMDVTAIGGGGKRLAISEALLSRGLVDLLASDTHGDARSLVPARRWLAETASLEHAELLTRENAHRLLLGKPMIPVPALKFERPMVERLRELLGLGRR